MSLRNRTAAAVVSALLCASPAGAQAPNPQIEAYAQQLGAYLGTNYTSIFRVLAARGWSPEAAYEATWAYSNGFKLGYFHGWYNGAFPLQQYASQSPAWKQFVDSFTQAYGAWQAWHQNNTPNTWGMFQIGYRDGGADGKRAGASRPGTAIPFEAAPQANGQGVALQASYGVQIDMRDPWWDLPYVERAPQGPTGRRR